MATPESGVEFLVPDMGDVIMKYTWVINKYSRCIKKRDSFDSPAFQFNTNGIRTRWNLSIRFWKGPDGKRVKNPVVVCLNLLGCGVEEPTQARVRYQFGVYNTEVGRWEMCDPGRVALHLQDSRDILSVGHHDVDISERHASRPAGDVAVTVRLRVAPTDADPHGLSRDLARLLGTGGDVTIRCGGGREFRAHSVLLRARSSLLDGAAGELVDLGEVEPDVVEGMLRYVYTDRVDNLEAEATSLLAAADRFHLPGLKAQCERSLADHVTPESVAPLLLIADQFNCESLKKTLLSYCEDNVTFATRTVEWRVMELVDPELFIEGCEAGFGSSTSSNLESLASDSGIAGL